MLTRWCGRRTVVYLLLLTVGAGLSAGEEAENTYTVAANSNIAH